MHGGKRSGAPRGNRNALKHALTTREALEQERAFRALLRTANDLLEAIERDVS